MIVVAKTQVLEPIDDLPTEKEAQSIRVGAAADRLERGLEELRRILKRCRDMEQTPEESGCPT